MQTLLKIVFQTILSLKKLLLDISYLGMEQFYLSI